MLLIDEWMPEYDAASRHSILIAAPLEEVWEALLATDFHLSPGHSSSAGAPRGAVPAGLTRAAWAFDLATHDRATRLSTETRVRCGGATARLAFRFYWTLIRPLSGLIRLVILGQVRAERRAATWTRRRGLRHRRGRASRAPSLWELT